LFNTTLAADYMFLMQFILFRVFSFQCVDRQKTEMLTRAQNACVRDLLHCFPQLSTASVYVCV